MMLDGRKIIVTGGITGIGKATALEMVKEGASVVTMSRAKPDEDRVLAVMDQAKQFGTGSLCHLKCDVTNRAEVDASFEEAIGLLGGLDVMMNSAGQEHQGRPEDLTEEDLLAQLTVHVCGTAWTNTAAFRHYKTAGGGAIINYASYAGSNGMTGMPAYSAAKGGVIAYTRVIAKDWARYNIRANVILPAVFTEMAALWVADQDEQTRQAMDQFWVDHLPLGGKLGQVEEAAHLNVFMASKKATFIHGQTIGVDGGLFMGR